ncbi:expressed unknown protein [Seminavis robusta]|uniref:Uncharacterized protein n=1 Tax=Seminavis robusta TaxID=568900 RepID=A0A9N8EI42_9STRA|nr:expressed unknown protein [Seminavis robusta]|eukprot:Sro1117_g242980.1 n/a (227) ;mRNA; r:22009-22787
MKELHRLQMGDIDKKRRRELEMERVKIERETAHQIQGDEHCSCHTTGAPYGQPHSYGISSETRGTTENWNDICESDYGTQATFLGTGTNAWALYNSNFARMQILYPGLAKNTIYMLAAGVPGQSGAAKYIRYRADGSLEYIQTLSGNHLVLCGPDDPLVTPSEAPSSSPSTASPTASPTDPPVTLAPNKPAHAHGSGDPHFTTFGGHKFDVRLTNGATCYSPVTLY